MNLYNVAITYPKGLKGRTQQTHHWLVVAGSEPHAVENLRIEQPQAFQGAIAWHARVRPNCVLHMIFKE